jgi:hypothetical protein
VIPVIICVGLTANDSVAKQHFVLNMLMEKLTGIFSLCRTVYNNSIIDFDR